MLLLHPLDLVAITSDLDIHHQDQMAHHQVLSEFHLAFQEILEAVAFLQEVVKEALLEVVLEVVFLEVEEEVLFLGD